MTFLSTNYDIEHNAINEREAYMVKRAHELLQKVKFPRNRVKTSILIDYTLSDFANHKLDVAMQGKQLYGTVVVSYSGLALYQDPEYFYRYTVPHQLAHVLLDLEKSASKLPVETGHGRDWQNWLLKLERSAPTTSGGSEFYDFRTAKLYKGGLPAHCECEDPDGFEVLSNRQATIHKIKHEELMCNQCGEPYRLIDHDLIPEKHQKELSFIKSRLCKIN